MQCTICQTSDLKLDPVLYFLVRFLRRLSPKAGLERRMVAYAGRQKLAQGILHDDGVSG